MKKLVIALSACALLAGACGGKNSPSASSSSEPSASSSSGSSASGGKAKLPTGVKKAPTGKINAPANGEYSYEYSTEDTNAATPQATPRRSKPDAQLHRTVSRDGDVIETADQSTEGPAVATIRQKLESDGLFDLGAKIVAGKNQSSCDYESPLLNIRFPLKAGSYPKQAFTGKGNSCAGERTIKVVGKEVVKDANGLAWSTWRIEIDTTVRGTGLTKVNHDTRWYSPDLGEDIKFDGSAKYINAQGGTSLTATQHSLLLAYPT